MRKNFGNPSLMKHISRLLQLACGDKAHLHFSNITVADLPRSTENKHGDGSDRGLGAEGQCCTTTPTRPPRDQG